MIAMSRLPGNQEERVHKLSMKATAQQAITSNASAMNGGSSGAAGMPDRQPWHALGVDETVARMETRPDGLTNAEAVQRLKTYGSNVIPRGKGDTALDLIWRQVNNPLIWVLIVSALVAMAVDPTGGVKNGLVILAVVVLNTIIGFVQEFKAGKAIEALSRMVPENVSALREGRKLTSRQRISSPATWSCSPAETRCPRTCA